MENWKDYVSFQSRDIELIKEKDLTPKVFFVKSRDIDGSAFELKSEEISEESCVYTEDNIGNAIEQTLQEFPSIEVSGIGIEHEKLNVAKNTCRGIATTNWENTWYYNGSTNFDRPIIVYQLGEKYGIFKHPDFDKYGFNVA